MDFLSDSHYIIIYKQYLRFLCATHYFVFHWCPDNTRQVHIIVLKFEWNCLNPPTLHQVSTLFNGFHIYISRTLLSPNKKKGKTIVTYLEPFVTSEFQVHAIICCFAEFYIIKHKSNQNLVIYQLIDVQSTDQFVPNTVLEDCLYWFLLAAGIPLKATSRGLVHVEGLAHSKNCCFSRMLFTYRQIYYILK